MKDEKFVEDDPRAIKVIRIGMEKMDKSEEPKGKEKA